MSNYFISVIFENDMYFGKVFTTSSNQLVYTSKGYHTQEQASKDARTYVITSAPPAIELESETPKNITTTTNYTTSRFNSNPPTGRCCGR